MRLRSRGTTFALAGLLALGATAGCAEDEGEGGIVEDGGVEGELEGEVGEGEDD